MDKDVRYVQMYGGAEVVGKTGVVGSMQVHIAQGQIEDDYHRYGRMHTTPPLNLATKNSL